MTVAACLQAGTRADVAWLVDTDGLQVGDWSDSVVFTPGGGRAGSLLGGALDGKLGDLAGRWPQGRLVDVEVTPVDALISELPSPGRARCLLVPADQLPAETWGLAARRATFCLDAHLDGDEVRSVSLLTEVGHGTSDEDVHELFTQGESRTIVSPERVATLFVAVPQMVVVGSGPVADALVDVAASVGWQSRLVTEQTVVTGVIAALSPLDKVVVAAHDLELAGAGLAAALESECGYIGSVGSRKMQADRADWLAYRGVTDLSRVHGPAGLDIGASTPGEIAVSIAAEAIETARAGANEPSASPN